MRHPGQFVSLVSGGEHWAATDVTTLPLRWWERLYYRLRPWEPCRVYWRSHGCDLRAGHRLGHRCDCGRVFRGGEAGMLTDGPLAPPPPRDLRP